MIATRRFQKGLGDSAIYLRIRRGTAAGGYWNFGSEDWDAVETGACRTFLTEQADSDPIKSRYLAEFDSPAEECVAEIVRLADGEVLADDLTVLTSGTVGVQAALPVIGVGLRDNALCTAAAFAGDTGNADADTAVRYINAASAMVEAYLGRKCGRQVAFEEALIGWGGPRLYLSLTPVEVVTSISVDDTEVDAAEYLLEDSDTGLVYRLNGWPWSAPPLGLGIEEMLHAGGESRNVTAVYTGGWVLPNEADPAGSDWTRLPADIEEAACLLAAHLYRMRGRNQAVASESIGNTSVAFMTQGPTGWAGLPAVASLLAPYRRMA
jgi:hypothetical protein